MLIKCVVLFVTQINPFYEKRIGTKEVESVAVSHLNEVEVAVAPFSHKIKGQAIESFIRLMQGIEKSTNLS